MNSTVGRRRIIVAAVATTAVVVPAAQAYYYAPSERATTSSSSAQSWTASSSEIDQLGPKHVPLQHPIAPARTTLVKVVKPAGFVWADAAIGADVASLALALVAALTLVITRRTHKTIAPEQSKLAGA